MLSWLEDIKICCKTSFFFFKDGLVFYQSIIFLTFKYTPGQQTHAKNK